MIAAMIAQGTAPGVDGSLTRQAFCHLHSACGERTVMTPPASQVALIAVAETRQVSGLAGASALTSSVF